MRIERERKQAIFDALYDRGLKIAEAAAAAGTDYSNAQRCRMVWEGRKSLEERQLAAMSPSARRAANKAKQDAVDSVEDGGDATPAVPVPKFDPDRVHEIVRGLNATLDGVSIAKVLPRDTDDDPNA